MNFSFYIYGTPNGYNQYPSDNNSVDFREFAQNNNAESQLTVKRSERLVYYVYVRRLPESTNHFIGFCLVFNGMYCTNPKTLFSLFDRSFDDTLMNGELLKFEKGRYVYTFDKFAEKQVEIDRIKAFFKDSLESDFTRNFVALPSSFKVGNGSKTISVKDSKSKILAAIAEYDCVHISNNEKSLSELERTHKLLTGLYAEKQELQSNYNKLIVQKKQYKAVFFLCLIVICCVISLLVFNSNLKNRDSQINYLNAELTEKNQNIENLHTAIAQLQLDKQTLSSEISALKDDLQQKIDTISSKDSEIENLNANISMLNSNNSYLRKKLSAEQDNYYKVNVSEAYCYHKCGSSYYKDNCYYRRDVILRVYYQSDGYGLTTGGYIEMSNLIKQ
jgi:outer membrane murein-binding lipoprotein Lpp